MHEFHPDAARSFAQRAELLLTRLRENAQGPEAPAPTAAFAPNVPIAGRIADSDIAGIIRQSFRDADGEEIAIRLISRDGQIHLTEENYSELRALAEAIHRVPFIRDSISAHQLFNWVADWVLGSALGQAMPTLPTYLLQERLKAVGQYRILVPLFEPYIEAAFSVGQTALIPMSQSDLEDWLTVPADCMPSNRPRAEQRLTELRTQLQARTAAVVELQAERRRAEEVAWDRADLAAAMVRLFSKAMFFPKVRSNCRPLGCAVVETRRMLVFRDGAFVGSSESIIEPEAAGNWFLDQGMITRDMPYIAALGALLEERPATDFRTAVLRALLLYSRLGLTSEVSEKLIHLFAALESLLLKSETEPIQSAVSERMAFVCGRDPADRAEISSLVKHVYGLRSRFVHHGRDPQDRADLRAVKELLKRAWAFFFEVALSANHFPTKEAFLAAVEARKWR